MTFPKKYFLPLFFSLLSFFFFHFSSRGTHLMGGNISYEYLGETFPGSGTYSYRITLVTFLDCTSPYWGTGFPETSLDIGVYEGSATPINPLPFVTTINLPLVDSVPVAPPLPSGCAIADIPCIYQITYIQTVNLPLSFSGYHLYYERCCRNGTVMNLDNPGGQGMVFSAYIPPTIAVNSSPVFTDMPVPFICVNDTTGILNTATDPDGDLLIFSFEDAYEGEYTDGGNPAISDYNAISPINVPFPSITWAPGGYDKNKPFGPTGYAFINSFTGYSQYKPVAIGNYVIAVEIKEYRNGNLIGITRRDMQLMVINCPANSTPLLSSSGGSGTTSYTIQEGQSLCFPITFTDPNTTTLIATGNIFNSTFTNPPATISSPVTGTGSVSTQFCWNTGCNQGQALPYLFNAEATDNGCPPKTTPVVYSITVNNFTGPTTITGVNNVCPGISGLSYSTTAVPGATYNWVVTGGTIVSGQGTNSVTVNWGNGPSGNVAVTTTSQFGCPAGPINLPVTFNSPVTVLAGSDKSICIGDTVTIGGSPTAPSGTNLAWSPSGGLSSTTIQNPVANPAITTTYIATATNGSGCTSKDTVVVTVNSLPVANAGNDTTLCLSSSVQLSASGGTSYQWFPTTGLTNPNISNPVASPADTTIYSVIVTSVNNCKDTDQVKVNVITDTPADAGPDKTICEGDSVLIGGTIQVPLGATIAWVPNMALSNNSVLNPKAAPSDTTTYILTINTAGGCIGTDTVTVNVNPIPLANAGNDTLICDGDTALLSASGGTTYQWSPASGLSNTNISNPLAFPPSNTQYIVTVSANNCSKKDTIFLTVFSSTLTTSSDTSICPGDTVQLLAAASGNPLFVWTPPLTLSDDSIFNPLAFPVDTIKYYVNATDTNSCSSTDSLTVIVYPLPSVDAGSNQAICFGDSALLGATGGLTYAWLPASTLSDDSIQNPLAFPPDTTTYYVTATDAKSCKNSDSVTVIVYPVPIAQASNDTTICEGETVQLNASGGSNYLWTPAAFLTDQNISNPQSTPNDTIIYLLVVSDNNSCTDSDSVIINVNKLPIANAGNDTWICPGDSAQLIATGGNFFSWTPLPTLSDPGVANPLAGPSDTTKYYVTVTNLNSCSKMDSVTVYVNGTVPTEAGPDQFICLNDSVQIGGAPTSPNGTIYSWTPALNLNDANAANPFAKPGDTTLFYLVTTNDTCSGTDSVLVIVQPLPLADAGTEDEICIGDTLQLSATGGITFVWSNGNTLSDDSIFNPLAFPSDTTKYHVTVTDANSCSKTDSVLIAVNELPVVDAGINDTICSGDSVQLIASGTSALIEFTWSPESSLSDDSIASPFAKPSAQTLYLLNVADTNGCKGNDSVLVSIFPDVVTISSDTGICVGDTTQLLVTGGAVFSWIPAVSLDDDSVSNPLAYPSDTTRYYVNTLDTNGCSNFDSVTVVVYPLPVLTVTNDTAICIGNCITLNVSGADLYVWSPVTGLDFPDISNPQSCSSDTIMYYVNGTSQATGQCSNTDSVLLTINPQPIAQASNDTAICSGKQVQLNASGGVNYQWYPVNGLDDPGISNPVSNIINSIEYFVIVTDINNCSDTDSVMVSINELPDVNAGTDKTICTGDTTQLLATGGVLYAWNDPLTLSDDSIADPLAFPADTAIYIVNITDTNNCSKADTVQVIVNPLPNADAGPDDEICIGDTIKLEASGGIDYSWVFSTTLSGVTIRDPFAFPVDTTKYFVNVTDANGCSKLDSVQIDVNDLPVVSAGIDTNSCRDSAVVIGGNPTGPPGSTYFWTPSMWLNNNTISNPIANPDTSTVFYINITDTNGCKNVDSTVVGIFTITGISDTSLCIGDSITLFVTPISGSNPVIYQWTPVSGLSSSTEAIVKASPDSPVVYNVLVTDGKGCMATKNISVTAYPPPVANFDFTISPSCEGVLAEFKNKSEGASDFQWIFGDETKSTKEDEKHIFVYNQLMQVTLLAMNQFCIDDTSFSDNIRSFSDYVDLKIPNVVTPNNDGLNDCFEISYKNLGDCSDLHVFNRWGELMYESAGNQHRWCGRTFAGEEVPEGTYFYIFDVNGFLFKGAVMVVR